mmetsp:Transcript_10244/g.21767  ORF Transcript_10244/g.21767 Transcript_10244/m.21767 type:complete len:87 (-) Transcript_10244:235-495(-)
MQTREMTNMVNAARMIAHEAQHEYLNQKKRCFSGDALFDVLTRLIKSSPTSRIPEAIPIQLGSATSAGAAASPRLLGSRYVRAPAG